MVGCDCRDRCYIEVRGLLKAQGHLSVAEAINNYRCDKCGQPASTACLLSQVKIV